MEKTHAPSEKSRETLVWELGFAQGSHQRLRTAIQMALKMIDASAGLSAVRSMLLAVIDLDDQLRDQAVGPFKRDKLE